MWGCSSVGGRSCPSRYPYSALNNPSTNPDPANDPPDSRDPAAALEVTARASQKARIRPEALVVMARRPVVGQGKTRLAQDLGAETAAGLYGRLLRDTLARAATVSETARYIALTTENGRMGDPAALDFAEDWSLVQQRGEGLGERLANVFADLFVAGHETVVIIGSDSPSLPPRFLESALARLREDGDDAALGPAFDGGYYLIALHRRAWLRHQDALRSLLEDSPMGTVRVARHTLDALDDLGLRCAVLPAWIDVDTASDAAHAAGLGEDAPRRGGSLERLREVYLHVTHRCDTGCPQCYLSDVRDDADDDAAGLSAAAWRDAIDQAARLGATSFVFIGGDPFLRPDLLDLIDHVTGAHQASARLFFNRGVDADAAERLAEVGRGRLVPLISVDGTAEINDRLRGQGNFASVLTSVRALLGAGLRPVANTVLLRPVLEDLPRLMEVLADEGLATVHFILPHSRGGLASDVHMVPSGEELLAGFEQAEIAARRAGIVIDNVSAWRSRLRHPRDLCSAGCTLLAIDPDGLVHACPITCGDPAFVAGDLRAESLETIWRRSPTLDLLRAAHARDREECRGCSVVDACGGECWVQAHYAASAAAERAGYLAPFPYCGMVRPLLERLAAPSGTGIEDGPVPAPADLTPFDCI
jgi:rSAM/selenodomain-associated transferase 1